MWATRKLIVAMLDRLLTPERHANRCLRFVPDSEWVWFERFLHSPRRAEWLDLLEDMSEHPELLTRAGATIPIGALLVPAQVKRLTTAWLIARGTRPSGNEVWVIPAQHRDGDQRATGQLPWVVATGVTAAKVLSLAGEHGLPLHDWRGDLLIDRIHSGVLATFQVAGATRARGPASPLIEFVEAGQTLLPKAGPSSDALFLSVPRPVRTAL